MDYHEIFSVSCSEESLASCDITLLKELIAQNFKKIEKNIEELSEISTRLNSKGSEKAIA